MHIYTKLLNVQFECNTQKKDILSVYHPEISVVYLVD